MKNQIEQYNQLKNKTYNQLYKAYKKLDGEKLERTINQIHEEAGVEAKKIIEVLLTNTNVKDEIKEIFDDLNDIIQNDVQFIFEDSEIQFEQLETQNIQTNND